MAWSHGRRRCLLVVAVAAVGHGQSYSRSNDSCSVALFPSAAGSNASSEAASAGATLLQHMYAQPTESLFGSLVWTLGEDEAEAVTAAMRTAGGSMRKCTPDTYLEMPADSIFESAAFAMAADGGGGGDGGGHERRHTVMDLGAGVGKVVASAVMLHGAARGVGVELSTTRFEAGCAALRALSECEGDGGEAELAMGAFRHALHSPVGIELRRGDVAEAVLAEATRVIVFATCFPEHVTSLLQRRMASDLPMGARVFIAGHQGSWQRSVVANSSSDGSRELAALLSEEEEALVEKGDVASLVWVVRGAAADPRTPDPERGGL